MVTLVDKLLYMFPDADSTLFGVDGIKNKIVGWQQSFPQPTQEELDIVSNADIISNELDVAQTNTVASKFQLKMALYELGLLDAAKDEYNAIADPLLKLEWSDNNVIRRNGPLALDMQTRFSKTDQKMDDLFALAQTY